MLTDAFVINYMSEDDGDAEDRSTTFRTDLEACYPTSGRGNGTREGGVHTYRVCAQHMDAHTYTYTTRRGIKLNKRATEIK